MAHDQAEDSGYSIQNAVKFGWSSVSGNLFPERVDLLEKFVVGHTVLDAGCGGGGYVDHLSRRGLDVSGVDKFGEFLAVAEEKGFSGKFFQADIASMPFPDKSFDCTVCFDVLEHVDDVEAIKELARVTRKRILLTVPAVHDVLTIYGLTTVPYCDQTHLRYYTEDSLKSLAQTIAIERVEVLPSHRIDFGRLIREMLDERLPSVPVPEIKKTDSSWNRGELKRRIFNFLARTPTITEMYKRMYTDKALYKDLYVDLFAVIDLP